MWNQALTEITGIDAGEAVGSQLQDLPNPWYELLLSSSERTSTIPIRIIFSSTARKNL